MTYQEKLKILEDTRDQIVLLRDGKATENSRTLIEQSLPIVMDLVSQAETGKIVTLYPPPVIGGPILPVRPLDSLYGTPYGMGYEIRGHAIDIINATIGVLKAHPEKFSAECRTDGGIWAIMHPDIVELARPRFEAKLYADAVEAAFKEINVRVKDIYVAKTGNEKDGAGLMLNAFSVQHPVLKLNNLSNQTERDIQDGYMHMFAGAMSAIRNPKAHGNEVISAADALRKIAYASMLMYKLDEMMCINTTE